MTPADAAALLRRLATNRDTFTEWVISRAETQAVLELVAQRDDAIRRLISGDYSANDAADWLAHAQEVTIEEVSGAVDPVNLPNVGDPDPYLHTTLHGVKVKVLLDD